MAPMKAIAGVHFNNTMPNAESISLYMMVILVEFSARQRCGYIKMLRLRIPKSCHHCQKIDRAMRQVSATIIGGLTVANTKRLQNPMVALAASLRYGSAMLPAVLQAAADSPI